ncbi:MAG: NUDIX domain-containing protein [Enhydrobacter sp.]|nr:MAG: NUDIX domain-containing protein [Enhydrobacter sp.]
MLVAVAHLEIAMRIVVNAVLVRGRELLMAKRSPKRRTYPGLWSFPGGHVEGGETLGRHSSGRRVRRSASW